MVRGLIAAALLLAAPVAAQQPQVPPALAVPVEAMSWMIGEWHGGGTMFGHASEAIFEVRPVLGGRFLEFSYRASRCLARTPEEGVEGCHSTTGESFEGRAFYSPLADGGWRAQWFDNRGVSFPIAARLAGRTLTSEWGSAETERGRTIYRLAEDGRLHVTDSVSRPDGSCRDFASHVLTRQD